MNTHPANCFRKRSLWFSLSFLFSLILLLGLADCGFSTPRRADDGHEAPNLQATGKIKILSKGRDKDLVIIPEQLNCFLYNESTPEHTLSIPTSATVQLPVMLYNASVTCSLQRKGVYGKWHMDVAREAVEIKHDQTTILTIGKPKMQILCGYGGGDFSESRIVFSAESDFFISVALKDSYRNSFGNFIDDREAVHPPSVTILDSAGKPTLSGLMFPCG